MNMLPSTHRLQFVNFQTFLDLVVLRGARFSVNEPLSSVYSKSFPEENNFRALNPRMHQYVSEDKKWSVSKTPVNLHGAGHLYPTYVFLSISCTADWARAQSGLWDPSWVPDLWPKAQNLENLLLVFFPHTPLMVSTQYITQTQIHLNVKGDLHYFPRTAVINCHKHHGLKEWKLSSWFWRPEVPSGGVTGLCSLQRLKEASLPLPALGVSRLALWMHHSSVFLHHHRTSLGVDLSFSISDKDTLCSSFYLTKYWYSK